MTFRQARDREKPSQATHVADLNLLEVAVTAARAAVAVIREMSGGRATLTWELKSPTDFVSAVDLAAEERIREVVGRLLPDAVVAGEERSPDDVGDEGLIFVADPLDGTTNFLHGYPNYAVSIGVLCDGRLAAGVVHNVVTGEVHTATDGHGAWLGDERLRVSSIDEPSRALVGTGMPFKDPAQITPYLPQLARMMGSTAGVRRAGSAALDLCDVARGRLDAFWELSLMPWDVAAGILLIREAGGIATDLRGHPAAVRAGGLVAGNPMMHGWLMEQLRRAEGA
ncbi:MAG TPA: inositol monophosphatase family protein [Gemmatimonadaceae bacterium]|nr:inositol monophosphatase family protein [Gemmatimonadaceae bacterium]